MKQIEFTSGYKYQLERSYIHQLRFESPEIVYPHEIFGYISIAPDLQLSIKRGYAWDGPSGPTIDTLNFMRGSLVHDALYQLIRAGILAPGTREEADEELRLICLEDGMSQFRAWYVHKAVHEFGEENCKPGTKELIIAP